ncbi:MULTISPECIES: Maf family protein [Methylosinus]|uniref:Nucleoside triphosphate pyrophosphatase n=1 Tax=Methylosinus trichosporium (strain ATCC 35070 / NCIMB 11131 / UNIQEM 75 / OB3b) TaxID=595536 RepID=A0A2D2D5X6_METT3|nr:MULTISPECIES: Maf family protein [Methylosinus]ATQ70372.1 septum formation inhibitor Maf [Methylosinus trichosporium OB3b]OBS53230.1 septum formation inhibitor Maf [Methylosinus sp. 3S-1]
MTIEPGDSLWRRGAPLALASQSAGRRLLLQQTGAVFVVDPADVDERAIEARVAAEGGGPDEIAARLAREKALAVSARRPGALVIGADQLASCEGRRFGKPADREAAAAQLRYLAGRTHRLHSAVALARDGALLFETVAHADLTMRAFSDTFLSHYLDSVGARVTTSAGAYQIEGLGVHLFERIEGDHSTILGLPLPPLLEALRREGALLS